MSILICPILLAYRSTARYKAWFCGRSLIVIVGQIPWGLEGVSLWAFCVCVCVCVCVCGEMITNPEDSYGVSECDRGTSYRGLGPLGLSSHEEKIMLCNLMIANYDNMKTT